MLIARPENPGAEYVTIAPDKIVCGPCFERKIKRFWKDKGKHSITTGELQALFQKPIPLQQKLF
jgi:hypothetical protein